MFLKILKYPNDILRKPNEIVEEVTPEVKDLILNMIETMHKADGVGLAAPQIGVNKRIIVVHWQGDDLVFINPKITKRSWRKDKDTEGCLSFPGLFVEIKRPVSISVTALGYSGKEMKVSMNGMFARMIQHEMDHLDGTLIVDRISKKKRIEYEKSLKK